VNEPSTAVNDVSRLIIGAALEVHRLLGPGFLEAVYEAALCIELAGRGIKFVRQAPISVIYKGQAVGEGRLDLLVEDCLIVELKAVESLLPIHQAQLLSYLKTTGHSLGLLINFNSPQLRAGVKRVVLTRSQA
jgi:GxxExxY protein